MGDSLGLLEGSQRCRCWLGVWHDVRANRGPCWALVQSRDGALLARGYCSGMGRLAQVLAWTWRVGCLAHGDSLVLARRDGPAGAIVREGGVAMRERRHAWGMQKRKKGKAKRPVGSSNAGVGLLFWVLFGPIWS